LPSEPTPEYRDPPRDRTVGGRQRQEDGMKKKSAKKGKTKVRDLSAKKGDVKGGARIKMSA
jgi:hypothetical protein